MTYATVPSKLKSSCLLIQQICQKSGEDKKWNWFQTKTMV